MRLYWLHWDFLLSSVLFRLVYHSSSCSNIAAYQGFAWLTKRVFDLVIEFIGPLYNLLQHFTNHYRRLDTLDFWTHYTNPLPQLNSQSQSQSQSHIATDGQSVSQSWCRARFGAHHQIFNTVRELQFCYCGASSLARGSVSLLSEPLSAVVSHLS
jgi:hypothetical protein